MPLLRCEHIYKTYAKKHWFSFAIQKNSHKNIVLHDINFDMQAGRSLGLYGKNGAGKSTLIRLILGLEKPDSGTIFLNNKDIHSMLKSGSNLFRKKIQAVFQNPAQSMNPRFSIFQVLEEGLSNFSLEELNIKHETALTNALSKKQKKELIQAHILKCMEYVHMKGHDLSKNVSQLSGGEQQRICIARALSLSPQILILDEAVSNLDSYVQSQILELLQELKKTRNITFLTVSHDNRVLLKLSEDIITLENGNVSQKISHDSPINTPF